ncbi:hypothetical protein HanRHA438_Chr15g0704111 [Helianthus annuus]|nr:hypothetical protein HanIR_Chr15g0751701 [Helianthus annuus]KAJ0844585.1 hypothetical protein HanRHA438_Chr15g0704111 [Helianthus annuus]
MKNGHIVFKNCITCCNIKVNGISPNKPLCHPELPSTTNDRQLLNQHQRISRNHTYGTPIKLATRKL